MYYGHKKLLISSCILPTTIYYIYTYFKSPYCVCVLSCIVLNCFCLESNESIRILIFLSSITYSSFDSSESRFFRFFCPVNLSVCIKGLHKSPLFPFTTCKLENTILLFNIQYSNFNLHNNTTQLSHIKIYYRIFNIFNNLVTRLSSSKFIIEGGGKYIYIYICVI